ncbi:MAG TPA: hypothetical protein VL171_03185 [Verrucomicrobiae bacterium]|nr:hypothetical protein [Verrucomicrobiae bacterium]
MANCGRVPIRNHTGKMTRLILPSVIVWQSIDETACSLTSVPRTGDDYTPKAPLQIFRAEQRGRLNEGIVRPTSEDGDLLIRVGRV